jgi:hypothetical protein
MSIALIGQVVSRWLPTEVTRFWAEVMSCGICGRQSGTEAGFLQVLWFPLPLIPLTAPHSSSVIQGWSSRPNNKWYIKSTQSHSPKKLLKKPKSACPESNVYWDMGCICAVSYNSRSCSVLSLSHFLRVAMLRLLMVWHRMVLRWGSVCPVYLFEIKVY